jgi:hypothetical protein
MDFTLYQGDTKRIHFTLKKEDGSPLELVGALLRWQASRLKAPGVFSSTPILAKTEEDGITIDDDLSGLVTVTLEPEDTAQLSGDFYMELETLDASGDVATVFTGTFQIKKALIKPPI